MAGWVKVFLSGVRKSRHLRLLLPSHAQALSSVAGRGRGRGALPSKPRGPGIKEAGTEYDGFIYDAAASLQSKSICDAEVAQCSNVQEDAAEHQWQPFDVSSGVGRGSPMPKLKNSTPLKLHSPRPNDLMEKFEEEARSPTFGFRGPPLPQPYPSQGTFRAESRAERFVSDWEEGVSRKEELLVDHALPNAAQWNPIQGEQPLIRQESNAAADDDYTSVNDPHPRHGTAFYSSSDS